MKIGWLIIGGVGAYFLYKSWQVSQALKTFQCYIKSVKFDAANSSVLETALTVTLTINNITPQPLMFQSFFGSVFLKNFPLANFAIGANQNTQINPGVNEVQVPVIVNNLNIAANIKDIIATWSHDTQDALVSVQGQLTVAGLTIPINQTLIMNQEATINGVGDVVLNDDIDDSPFTFSKY